ncbi:WW domain-containing protein [Nephila pilipes]|uniref:WW domain-containing protein n=1 Tax=Nephila pilipes TaxID=299642 RepID=A0A8X6P398_NEPPI|nr:WW domain-containing protein [Nephila pilipes]
MGKKLKGGRRQILQLEEKKPPKVPSKPKVKALMHYIETDDDLKKSNESEPSPSPSPTVNKDATPLDSQIADFFKEIDAMTVPEAVLTKSEKTTTSKVETAKQSTSEDCSSQSAVDLPTSVSKDSNQRDAQNGGAYCVWQEIQDSATGYNYYWNVQTNEVTWDCPAEYTNYIQSINVKDTEKELHVTQEVVNPDEKNKLVKKKKDNVEKEGSIIPISYYRKSSSSDESSDNERALSKSNKKQELAKVVEGKKSKGVLKADSKCKVTNEEESSNEIIGPHLPPEFQYPQTVSRAQESSLETLVSKSEFEKFIDIDLVLPLKPKNDLTEKPSQSNLNEFSAELAQTTSWATFLKDNEKCQKVHEQTGDESPDSTVKRIENLLGHSVHKANNSAHGFRPVVEYDSFTDEDEDVNVSNISSSKQITSEKCLDVKSSIQQNLESINKSTAFVSTMGKEINSSKRKGTSDSKHNVKKENLIKKHKKSNVDIDSLFTAHTMHGKYGFGWQKSTENIELHASSTQDHKTRANKNDYKAVNFIKSDDILDLRALNDKGTYDKTRSVSKEENIQTNICEQSKDLETKEEKFPAEKTIEAVEEPLVMKEVKKTCSDNIVGSSSSIALLKDKYKNIKNKRKKEGNFSNKVGLASIAIEEDLDEIDRALCEALDAKKAAKKSAPKPPSPSNILQDNNENVIAATSSAVSHEKTATIEVSAAHLPPGPLTDEILEASSALIDKLTFLLSAQSAVASLSGFFVQLQTRFLDWQAGGLDSEYFMARLKEAEQYIQQYEMSFLSGDWICQWDRTNKRYFYMNRKTHHSQWTYPEEMGSPEKSSWVQSQADAGSSSAPDLITERDDFQTVSSSSSMPENLAQKCSATSLVLESKDAANDSTVAQWILKSSPPPPPPGVDSPPPPPPISPPPKSPPPPPPDSTEKEREHTEPEDMDIEDSNDSSSFLYVSNRILSEDGRMQYLSMVEHPSLRSPVSFPNSSLFSAVSSTSVSGFEGLNTFSKLSQSVSYSVDSSVVNNMHWSQPSCSSQVKTKFDSVNTNVQSTEGKSLEMCASSSNGVCSSHIDTWHLNTTKPGNIGLKKDMKKLKMQPPLGLKNKHISSLVEKWEKIKEQQNKEDEDSNDY